MALTFVQYYILNMADHCLLFAVLLSFLAINNAQSSLCTSNTFQITGNGKVPVNPDIVTFIVSI
jgi:uncharacterized protein YggE